MLHDLIVSFAMVMAVQLFSWEKEEVVNTNNKIKKNDKTDIVFILVQMLCD
jgi:hypothetical protein